MHEILAPVAASCTLFPAASEALLFMITETFFEAVNEL